MMSSSRAAEWRCGFKRVDARKLGSVRQIQSHDHASHGTWTDDRGNHGVSLKLRVCAEWAVPYRGKLSLVKPGRNLVNQIPPSQDDDG
jgi:hypothetical protein